uniref:DNA-directed RNA polymerase I subunit rpa49 n=1 Tax=Polytomella parva TaxID=51329 RepID=A0A7S0URT1_9CHLO|mmetsp:Transcript_12525/g.22415  ORF Transcript_12525/g.22415 Transcript_12525/m.22415 type:complete len:563 (+) Transcript_12525:50-1738(+)
MSSKKRKVSLSVESQEEKILPVCYFPSGLNPSDTNDKDSSFVIDVQAKKVKKSTSLKVVANKGEVSFLAESEVLSADADTTSGSACGYAVAVYDKDTGKVHLAPLAGNRVLRLEPRIQGLAYDPTSNGATETPNELQAAKLANKKLVDEFGSTRRRRQLTAREEGIVRAEKLSGRGAVEQMLVDVASRAAGQGMTKDEVLQRSAETRKVPPHNPEATTPFEAYPLRLLLPSLANGSNSENYLLETKRLVHAAEDEKAAQALRDRRAVHPYVLSRLSLLRGGYLGDSDNGDGDGSDNKLNPVIARRAGYLALLSALLTIESRRFLKVLPVTVVESKAADATAGDVEGEEGSDKANAAPTTTTFGGMDGLARQLKIRPALLEDLLGLFYERSAAPAAPDAAAALAELEEDEEETEVNENNNNNNNSNISSKGRGGGSSKSKSLAIGSAVSYERPDVKKNLLTLYILVCALLAEDGALAVEQFERLKQALKLLPNLLVVYFTEIGATAKGRSVKLEPDSPLAQLLGGVTKVNSYTVGLLNNPLLPDKTLRESFPAIKIAKKAGGR